MEEYTTQLQTQSARRVDTSEGLCYNRSVMSSEFSDPQIPAVPSVQVIGLTGIPEIKSGDELAEIIVAAAKRQGTPVESGDVLVVTQKIVSKAEDRVVDLRDVEPSPFAHQIAGESDRDARLVELVLRESRAIVRMDTHRGIMITETKHGFICANAGIDSSNVAGDDYVALLPEYPDESARRIRSAIRAASGGTSVAIIISDTFGRAWREGHVNFAIGVAGMHAFQDYRGMPDVFGQTLKVTTVAVADELASAAELVTGKAIGVPVAIVRGYRYPEGPDGVQSLLRPPDKDLFR